MTSLNRRFVMGSGVMNWEPAWISSRLNEERGIGRSRENNAFFDFKRKCLARH